MGSDDLFKKKRAERKKRKYDIKQTRSDSYLIVTEGTKTEPFYFQAMKRKIEQSCGGYIQVKTIPQITIHGSGKGTNALLHEIETQVSRARIPFQHIWAVFDKDDFIDFHAVSYTHLIPRWDIVVQSPSLPARDPVGFPLHSCRSDNSFLSDVG